MHRFRARHSAKPQPTPATPLSRGQVREVIRDAIQPAHFFVGSAMALVWQHDANEEAAWEIYHGQLLDPAHTRSRQAFEAWNIFAEEAGQRSGEPILSVKLDAPARQLHVMRAIHCYAWEGYHAGENVYLSRETRKWVRELVGTISLNDFNDLDDLHDEIICLLFQAVVGCSRLPLTSVEAPLPAFSLGQLAYIHRPLNDNLEPSSCPMRSSRALIEKGLQDDLNWLEKAKLLEILLRSISPIDISSAAKHFIDRWCQLGSSLTEFMALLRTLFNEVALSPYTDFVDKTLPFLNELIPQGFLDFEQYVDFLCYVLRQNARHLTAYDLITFHHRGANYPDALLLDATLKAYRAILGNRPDLFIASPGDDVGIQHRKRIRRRALRQGWLLRRFYEGLLVPDAPTSPGENTRILLPPHIRVPEEQILVPAKRTKRLFEGEPLEPEGQSEREVLQLALTDLQQLKELQELGMALFLDRPLGGFKAPAEPDNTLLFSYEAFSRTVAERRLAFLSEKLDLVPERFQAHRQKLHEGLALRGIGIQPSRKTPRPGTVSIYDVLKVADDFLVLRTTRQAVRDFLQQFDFGDLAERYNLDYLDADKPVLILRADGMGFGAEGVLVVLDAAMRRRLELEVDPSIGYQRRAGCEFPKAGLRVLRVWQEANDTKQLEEHDLRNANLIVQPAECGLCRLDRPKG